MAIKLGMCGFTIARGTYYRRFPVVEVQQTFYDPPPLETLQRWRDEAPSAFEFTMKAWQVITHFGTSRTYRRLRSSFANRQRNEAGGFRTNPTVMNAWQRTVDCAEVLRATAILFQCPASFRPTDENISAMHDFFATIERPQARMLWEPRGAWPDDLVLELCNRFDLTHAVDPFVRPSLTPSPRYWRLHGNKSHYANFDDDELKQLRVWIAEMPDTETYVLFNNIPRVHDIKRFQELGLYHGW